MTTYTEVQARLRAEPKTWLVTGVTGFIGSNFLETSLKDLHKLIVGTLSQHVLLPPAKLSYRDFQEGDMRHSLPDISNTKNLLGYASTIKVGDGLRAAMPRYASKVGTR